MMLKATTYGVDMVARQMATAMSNAMGGGPTTPDYESWWGATFAAHDVYGAPNARSLSFATAYQATDPTKPAFINVIVDITTTIAVGSPQANTVELITGPTNAVASGTGSLADTYRSDLSVTLISLGFTGRQSLKANLPVGYYFAVRRTVGSGSSIISAFDQSVG